MMYDISHLSCITYPSAWGNCNCGMTVVPFFMENQCCFWLMFVATELVPEEEKRQWELWQTLQKYVCAIRMLFNTSGI